MAGGADRTGAGDALTQAVAGIGTRLDARLTDITRSISELLVSDIAELRDEEQLQQILADSVAANIDAFFAAARHGISIDLLHAPAAAIEHARRLAQRDISANVLVRSYRLGHQAVLKEVLEEVRTADFDPQLALDVFDVMSTISFNYIDRISQEVVEVYQQARESWLENRNSVRITEIRELLAGGDVDIDAATVAIRYPLQRNHLAVVLWCDDSEDRLADMERLIQQFAASIGAADSPLFVSVDRATAWAWVAVPAAVIAEAVTWLGSLVPADGPYVAAGTPQSGVAGFRLSHRQAEDARAVAVAPQFAHLVGINVRQTAALAFGLGGALVAACGVLVSMFLPFSASMGTMFAMKALIVVIMGGVGNLMGCLAAGMLLGFAETLVASFVDPGLTLAVNYGVFLLVLLLRPTGLFGRATR